MLVLLEGKRTWADGVLVTRGIGLISTVAQRLDCSLWMYLMSVAQADRRGTGGVPRREERRAESGGVGGSHPLFQPPVEAVSYYRAQGERILPLIASDYIIIIYMRYGCCLEAKIHQTLILSYNRFLDRNRSCLCIVSSVVELISPMR